MGRQTVSTERTHAGRSHRPLASHQLQHQAPVPSRFPLASAGSNVLPERWQLVPCLRRARILGFCGEGKGRGGQGETEGQGQRDRDRQIEGEWGKESLCELQAM